MSTQTLANIAGSLKIDYKGPIQEQLNNTTALWSRISKNEDDVSGEDLTAKIPLMYARNQGIGWRAASGTLPTSGRRNYTKASVAMAYLYGSIEIEGQAIKASRKNELAFAKAVDAEIRGMVQGLKLEVNRCIWGRGTGALARIGSGTTAVALGTLFSVDDVSRLEPGMVIDTFTTNATSGGTAGFDSKAIDQVDHKNNKISMVDDLSGASNEASDYIYREDSRGYVMMGLEGITDGADAAGNRLITTLEGITRSTSLYWDGNVLDNAGVNRALTIDLTQQAYELGEIIGQGKVSSIWSGYPLRRKYLDVCTADRRYVGTMKFDLGWSALEYTGGGESTPWFVDRMCLANKVFFLDEDKLEILRAADFDWMDLDGAVLRKVSSKDQYEGTCYAYMNLATKQPNTSTVLRDVA